MIQSRDNPKVKRWARLAREAKLRRAEGRALIEGPRLVAEALARGVKLEAVLVTEPSTEHPGAVVLPERVFASIVEAETPQGIAAEIAIPASKVDLKADAVFLEGVQDAGNVGAIIRSAAAFGIGTVYLGKGCADAWSPKVLRAAAGGHFSLAIAEGAEPHGKLVCTVPRGGKPIREIKGKEALCWVFGSEGAGISAELLDRADFKVTIPIREGTESLNVAAAAAICFHERFSSRARGS